MVQEKSLRDLGCVQERKTTAHPSKYPQGHFKDKCCSKCGELFSPIGPSHKYCSKECKYDAYVGGRYKRMYGITPEKVLEMYNEQGGKCAICSGVGFKMHKNKKHGLNLDHDHKTNKVRGWLCDNCNRGLGLFQDNPDILEVAIAYIRRNEESA